LRGGNSLNKMDNLFVKVCNRLQVRVGIGWVNVNKRTVFFELFLILQNSATVDESLTARWDVDHFFNFILEVLDSFLKVI
jgi:hypothetical protein